MTETPLDRDALRAAIAILVGGMTVVLSSTIVSVALLELAIDLEVRVDVIQWVVTAYLLALCAVIPVTGWLQNRCGAKRLWMSALALFLAGSVLCALAWDVRSLTAFRVIQGVGAGVSTPLLTTILMQNTPERDRVRITSLVALTTAVGPILGPVVGGLVLGVADWRWLFLINVPLCTLALALAWRLIPTDDPDPRLMRLDVIGLGLLSPALVALVWGLSTVTDASAVAMPEVLVPVVGGSALLAGFVLWARRRRGEALVDVEVLHWRPTAAATAVLFLAGAALHGAMLLLPLYWQQLRGADALQTGLLLIPQGVGSLLSRAVAVRIMARRGARVVSVVGFGLAGVATVPFATADVGVVHWVLLAALFVRGLGIGMVVIPLIAVAFVGVPPERVPDVSIVIRIGQQLGGSVGVAVLAAVLTAHSAASGSSTAGFHLAFWWAAGFAVVAMVLSISLSREIPRG